MNWDVKVEKELLADACRSNLWTFVQEAWGIRHWKRPANEGPPFIERIHKPVCDWFQGHALQWLETRQRRSLMLVIPRFFGKTTLITKAAQAWLHLHDPDLATYTGSESQTRAEEFLTSISRVLAGEDPYARFTWLYGNWYDSKREWRRAGMVHAKRYAMSRTEYSFGTWSVERGITGHHPDVGFFDDPTSYESMSSHSNWFHIVNNHVASIMPVFGDNCLMVFVGTRYGDGDHLGTELNKEGAATWNGMPCPPDYATGDGRPIIRPDGKWHVYFLDARNERDEPVFPERCSEEFLREYQRKHDLRYWAQMRNNPAQHEMNPLTRDRIDQCWCDAADIKRRRIRRVIITMDTAFKHQNRQASGDESVAIAWGMPMDGSGDVFYLDGIGNNVMRSEDYLDKIVMLVQKWRVGGRHVVLVDEFEPGGKQGTWELLIQKTFREKGMSAPPLVLLSRAGKRKVARIIEAANYWINGYVYLVRDAPGVHQLVNQMARIGNSEHDDWADAAADIFHPSVYTPIKKLGEIPPKDMQLYRPGDEVLKGPRLTNEDARRIYDDHWAADVPDRLYPKV